VEPVAVHAGLWSWSEPGLFHVPPIVPFGWSAFAGFSAWISRKAAQWRSPFFTYWVVIVLPVVGTHLILLMVWWSVFRWVSTPIHPIYGVVIAWTTTLYLLIRIRSNQTGKRVENRTLLLRLPGAVFFFALLAFRGGGSLWLPLYALAFAPPYLALLAQPYHPLPGRRL
jgi:hypothetical protein